MNHCLRIVTALSLLAVVSCKGKKSEPTEATPKASSAAATAATTTTAATTAAATTAAATTAAATTSIDAAPAVPNEPDSPKAIEAPTLAAYLLKGDTLIEAQTDGTSKKLGAFGPVTWCEVDSEANVVWGLGEAGLQAFDLSDASLHTLVASPKIESASVRFAKGAPAGNADGMVSDTALIVTIANTPSVKGEVICEGDREYYCYEDMESEDKSAWVLNEETKESLAAYNTLKLSDEAFVKMLAGRSANRGATPAPKLVAPEKPKVRVSDATCNAIPERCGEAEYVGGGRFWNIVTENDAGDFYYEAFQLYDTKTKEFVDLGTKKRQAKPFKTVGDISLSVSPDGKFAIMTSGGLMDLTKAEVVKELGDVRSCGWK